MGMITINRHQYAIACVRAGKGQPRYDCGKSSVSAALRAQNGTVKPIWIAGSIEWLRQLNSGSKSSSRLTKIKFICGCYFRAGPAAVFFLNSANFLFRAFERAVSWVQLSCNVIMKSFKMSRPLRCASCIV